MVPYIRKHKQKLLRYVCIGLLWFFLLKLIFHQNHNYVIITNDPEIIPISRPSVNKVNFRNKYWQAHFKKADDNNSDDREVVAFSSFYDIRTDKAYVRVLVVTRRSKDTFLIFCQLWFTDESSFGKLLVVEGEKKILGRVHHMTSSLSYNQEMISCRLPGNLSETPQFVSLAFEPVQNSSIYLPVEMMDKTTGEDEYEHEFVVCVSVAYGNFDSFEIAEWMEAHKLMGVGKVVIYNGSISYSPRLQKVLEHYIQVGMLDLRQADTGAEVYEEKKKVEAFRLSSAACFNDCMMRYAMKTRWVIVLDFDELILPTTATNYHELMELIFERERNEEVKKRRKILEKITKNSSSDETMAFIQNQVKNTWKPQKDYLFRMTYFFRYFEEDLDAADLIITNGDQLEARQQAQNRSTTKQMQSQQTTQKSSQLSINPYSISVTKKINKQEPTRTSQQTPPQTSIQPHYKMIFERYKTRTFINQAFFGSKSFINPRKCFSLFNHYCYIGLTSNSAKVRTVDKDIAKVHHYRRKCSANCEKLTKYKTFDRSIDKILPQLRKNLETVLKGVLYDL